MNLKAALAIFASAVLLRLVHIWQIREAPFFNLLFGDARAYDEWAQRIAAGDWIGSEVFYQAPLYPYLLGSIYALFDRDLLLVRIVQAVVGAAGCVLVALAGTRLFDRRTGIAAGAIMAVYAPSIFFDGLIQKTSLETFLICLLVYLVARLVDEPDPKRLWCGLGVTAGALCLSRENTLVFLPVVAAWIWYDKRLDAGRRVTLAGVFLAGLALLVLPVAARNSAIGGGLYLTTSQLGTNLYIGNHDGADGTYQALRVGRGTAEFERTDATELAVRNAGRPLTPSEVSSYWTRRAIAFMTSEPSEWGQLMLRKAMLLINAVDIVDTEDQATYAEWSWPLRLTAGISHFGVLIPLAVAGAWAARGRLRQMWVVPAIILTYTMSVVVFYVVARYRHPLVPLVALLAGAGVTSLPGLVRQSSPGERAGCATAFVIAVLLANWPLLSPDAMHAVGETNLGVALQAAGRTEEAVVHYQRAIALRSDDPTPYINLGTARHEMGRVEEASALFAKAVSVRSSSGEAHYFLAKTLLERGLEPDAVVHLRQAVAAMPESAEVRTSLGVALASQGQFNEAIEWFREVVQMTPGSAMAYWNLGSAIAGTGRFDQAVTALEESVRLDPNHPQARADLASVRQLRTESPDVPK